MWFNKRQPFFLETIVELRSEITDTVDPQDLKLINSINVSRVDPRRLQPICCSLEILPKDAPDYLMMAIKGVMFAVKDGFVYMPRGYLRKLGAFKLDEFKDVLRASNNNQKTAK